MRSPRLRAQLFPLPSVSVLGTWQVLTSRLALSLPLAHGPQWAHYFCGPGAEQSACRTAGRQYAFLEGMTT